ncbi:hypothetical protein [Corynebacterium aquilae]|uniref:hypothetical protein n=1 Tax=Corynebacterium aquilae TaxID=203263 RepID=UPI0012EDA4E3|nr:hypothetical protein [Corynebacterium aquilae]
MNEYEVQLPGGWVTTMQMTPEYMERHWPDAVPVGTPKAPAHTPETKARRPRKKAE